MKRPSFHVARAMAVVCLVTTLSITSSSGQEQNDRALDHLESQLNDSSRDVRDRAFEKLVQWTTSSNIPSVRQRGPDILCSIFYRDEQRQNHILASLTRFRVEDFSQASRDSVAAWVRRRSSGQDMVMKLAGFLQLSDTRAILQARAIRGNTPSLRWHALLGIARMGDAYAVDEIMMRVKRLPVNDEVVYKVFPDLLYTRQRKCVAYVVDALHDDAQNCLSADVERDASIPCGYRIMEQLATVIRNYPIARDAYGDLNTDDYRDALRRVRQWFDENPEYIIINNTF